MAVYHTVAKTVAPKRAALKLATEQLAAAQVREGGWGPA